MHQQIIAVIADTHVPDRVRNLHPGLIPALKELGVKQILHAGDLCNVWVLDAIKEIAPITAVCGNRDIFLKVKLPAYQDIVINGIHIGLSHGHGNLWTYFLEKLKTSLYGYRLNTYLPILEKKFPHAKVVIFGHSHFPENVWIDGRLYFNPGSVGLGGFGFAPSFGLLKIDSFGQISSDIIYLENSLLVKGNWVEY